MSFRILVVGTLFYCAMFEPRFSQAGEPVKAIRPNAVTGSAAAVICSARQILITEQIQPLDARGKLVGRDDVAKQIEQAFLNLSSILKQPGARNNRIVKVNFYVARDELVKDVQTAMGSRFMAPDLPAVSFVTTRLPHPDALAAVDAVVALDGDTAAFTGPQLVRQSSFAVATTQTLFFVSGQAEKAADLQEATRKTLLSLEASLKFCGRSKQDVRQIKCFFSPMSQAAEVVQEIREFYNQKQIPPLSFVEWQSTLPIEIEVLADGTPDGGLEPPGQLIYLTPPGLPASPVFSRICRIHNRPLIFVSGLYGEAGSNGTQQVESIFRELDLILKESGSDLKHLAKATYYVSQDEASQKLNELRPKYYDPKSPPSASKAQVVGVGKPGTGLTIDMIAIPSF